MDRRRFLTTAGAAAGASLISQAAFGSLLPSISSSSDKKPNILLIMTDQQSADAMSRRIGKRYLNTPAVDSIAAAGTFFTRAYCSNPLCIPSRTSLFSGLYPHQTKVQTNSDAKKFDPESARCMGAIFRDAGYDTALIGKWHIAFPEKDAAAHGFELTAIKNNGFDSEVAVRAEEFLRTKRTKPFLLVASFINPHNICEWARGDKLPDGEVGTPPALDQCPPLIENHPPMENEPDIVSLIRKSYQSAPMFPVGNFDAKKWREYRWAYYRMIEKVDALIGRVIQALRDSAEHDNTVIVFTSDHGDCQGAHGWNQKTVLFDEASRVPLVISAPGGSKGRVCDRLVNTGVDMIPSLCGVAGIPVPKNLPGLALMNGARLIEKDPRNYLVVQNHMIQGEPIDGQKPEPNGRMIRSRTYKYCAYDMGQHRESLVDVESDPGEMVNLAGKKEYRSVLERHRQYLAEWCQKYSDPFTVTPS